MKRLVVTLIGAMLVAAPAAQAKAPITNSGPNFRVTVSAPLVESGGGIFVESHYAGTAIVPHIGPANVTILYGDGCSALNIPIECVARLLVRFTPVHGDHGGRSLVLFGEIRWLVGDTPPTQWDWTAIEAYGFTGSGTFTEITRGGLGPITVSLVGTVRPVAADG